MATTPNFGFVLPNVGSDLDTWGGDLNDNWSGVDVILQNFMDAQAAQGAAIDAINALLPKLHVQVGSLYISDTDTDPATTLGYGTWTQVAEGRAIVGAGNGDASDATEWLVGDKRGSEGQVITIDQMAAHLHDRGSYAVDPAGSHTHDMTTEDNASSGGSLRHIRGGGSSSSSTKSAGDHSHNLSGQSALAGAGQPHNNIQPSEAFYIYRRDT